MKSIKKLLILIILCAFFMPFNTYAVDEEPTNPGENTEEHGKENEGEKEPEKTPEPTPEKTPEPTPTPEVIPDAVLDSLKVEGYDSLNEVWDKTRLKYTLNVPANTESIKVIANGNEKLVIEPKTATYTEFIDNLITAKVKVTNGKGITNTYIIEITRSEKPVELKSLSIERQALNESFQSNRYEYTMNVVHAVTSLDIKAVPSDEGYTVEITGNEDLKEGENIVSIKVSNQKDTTKDITYRIKVNREVSDNVTSSSEMIVTKEDNSNSVLKYVLITILCALMLILAVVAVIFFKKSKKKNDEDDAETKEENKNEVEKVNNIALMETADLTPVDENTKEAKPVSEEVEEDNYPKTTQELFDEEHTLLTPKVTDDILDGMDEDNVQEL